MLKRSYLLLKNIVGRRSAYKFFIRDWKNLTDISRCADAISTMRYSTNLEPTLLECPKEKRILVIAPHPDDEMIGPGGTLLKAIANGSEVKVLYLTRGRKPLAEVITRESTLVAKEVGYQQEFLDFYSKGIPLDEIFLEKVRSVLDDFKPEILMLPFFCDDHDDHRRASHLFCLMQSKRNLPNIPVWAYQVYSTVIGNVIVDITDVMPMKKKFITYWKSQAKSRNWANFSIGLNAFNSRFLSPNPSPCYAENFFVVPLPEYCEFAKPYFSDGVNSYYSAGYNKYG